MNGCFKLHYESPIGKVPTFLVCYPSNLTPKYIFFLLNNTYVQEMPIVFFLKWMEIAIKGESFEDYQAIFDDCVEMFKYDRNILNGCQLLYRPLVGGLLRY